MCARCDAALDSGGLPRCLDCGAFVCEDATGSLPAYCGRCLERDQMLVATLCAAADAQAPVANDAVPVRIDEVPTKRMLAIPSNRELMAHLAQRAEAGQGDDL